MQLRGNYVAFFIIEFFAGILTAVLCWFYGDAGLWGLAIFVLGMVLTQKTSADEREMLLLYKVGAFVPIAISIVMFMVYLKFTYINWFHAFISFSMIARGISGIIVFSSE